MKEVDLRSLGNKTIVITGATSGAGRAAAIELAKHKALLVLASRSLTALNNLADECAGYGAIALGVVTDVTDATSVKNLAAVAAAEGGKIDVWINNAGVLAAGGFTDTPVEVHSQVIKTNLIGYIHGAYAVLPYFKKQKYGILINNISVGAWLPVPYAAGYSASKFGLRGFSEALRGELIKWPGIHICDIFPAFLDTPGIQHAANYTGKILKPAPPVYDPARVARKMLQVILHPAANETVGSIATLLRFSHFLLPGFTRFCMAKVMEWYFKQADAAPYTSGNVFEPVEYGTSIYGGWSISAGKERIKRIGAISLLAAGIGAGLYIIGRNEK